MKSRLSHPFVQALLILAVAYLLFRFGIAYIPPLLGVKSAPVPHTVLLQYMLTVAVGVLLYVSATEDRWRAFKAPIQRVLVDPSQRLYRLALLVTVPLLAGFITYRQVRPSVEAPPNLRSIHPAPPSTITFRGKTMTLAGLENPLRKEGNLRDHVEEGRRVYYQNCVACHGDQLNGKGHFAHGFNPPPADFTDNGTIPQLTESFVFWRIAKGGRGLPKEGTPWNSAMPAWEDFLTEREIWAVIIFLYDQTGWTPRTWDTAEGGAR
ncbi:MAG: cytochrome c [Gemmatimonadetes bacterium]|nr:cytochrome c [Gemmatimonadota bacterium]